MNPTNSRPSAIGSIFLGLLVLGLLELGRAGAPNLPPIWSEVGLDDESESLGTFRILSELHLDDRSSYLVEEWLDGPHRRFRLEVLPLHNHDDNDGDQVGAKWTASSNRTKAPGGAGAARLAFLIDGARSERFFFKPFKCYNMNQPGENELTQTTSAKTIIEREAKLGQLFNYFPADGQRADALVLGGVSALWLAALSSRAPVKFKRAKALGQLVEGRRRGKSKSEVMKVFDKFTVDSSESFAYQTEFYFQPSSSSDQESPGQPSVEPGNLMAIHLIDPDYKKTKLSARIIRLDIGLASLPSGAVTDPGSTSGGASHTDLRGNLFELPLGYGCERASSNRRQLDYKPPRNCFHTEQPHTCHLEASIWVPPAPNEDYHDHDDASAEEPDLDRWRQHASSMRIVSGRLLGRDYVSLEASDFAPVAAVQAELNLDTLEADGQAERWQISARDQLRPGSMLMRRAKRIWDLGEAPTKEKADEAKEDTRRPTASAYWKPMHFGLGDHLRSCLAVGEARLEELPSIDFELRDFDEGAGQRLANRTSRTVGLSLIDHKMLADFFENLDGFKLIREDSESWRKFQSVHQEKRIERFEFRDMSGKVNWIGPVSIIRKFYFVDTMGEHLDSIESAPPGGRSDSSQPEVPLEALRVELTLIVLSRMLDRQLARIRLLMSPGLLIDEARLHRELDIGPCLESAAAMASNSCRPHWRPPPSASRPYLTGGGGGGGSASARQELTLVYPLEEPLPAGTNEAARSQVYLKFLLAITSESLLGSNGLKLNALQVNQLEVDIEPELVRVSCRINKWPHTYDYLHYEAKRPSSSAKVRLLLRELKPNAELCARTCSRYQCPVFAFSYTSKFCELYEFLPHQSLERNANQTTTPIELQDDLSSDTYERRLGSARGPYAEPAFVLARMREALLDTSGQDDLTNALAIRLELTSEPDGRLDVDLVPNSLSVGNEHWRQDKLMLEADRLGVAAGGQADGGSTRLVIDRDELEENFEPGDQLNWRLEIEFVYLMRNGRFKLDDQVGHSGEFPVAEARHLSQAECELLCLESDCRSYSYCDLTKSCIVSKLMEEAKIRPLSEREDFCKLMVVDQLSKFQATGQNVVSQRQLAKLVRSAESNERPEGVSAPGGKLDWLEFRFDSRRDCALACLETEEFVCKSFFFCQLGTDQQVPGPDGGDCYLFASRQSGASLTAKLNRPPAGQLRDDARPDANTSSHDCDYYQRSYMADYHEFHGRRLASGGAHSSRQLGQPQVELRLGLGAEECAAECSLEALSDRDAEGRVRVCRAFEVCLGDQSQSRRRQQLTCGLLIEDGRARGTRSTRQAANLLAEGPKCTAFLRLRSGRSYGSTPALDGGQNKLELEPLSQADGQMDSLENGRGFWSTAAAAVGLGMALGYSMSCAAMALARWRRQRRRQAEADN